MSGQGPFHAARVLQFGDAAPVVPYQHPVHAAAGAPHHPVHPVNNAAAAADPVGGAQQHNDSAAPAAPAPPPGHQDLDALMAGALAAMHFGNVGDGANCG